ncbi:MAG: ankyrin repeat domain-containing protein [Archangium sp.]|nr:ankyrin repeat domain-containing protein [Archangium sp.]
MTPDQKLLNAAQTGHLAGVLVSLDEGANIEAKDDLQRTPLACAVEEGHLEVVEALIQRKADVNAKTYADMTALHLAARDGHTAIVKRLLEASPPSERVLNDVLTVASMSRKSKPEIVTLLQDFRVKSVMPSEVDGDAAQRLIVGAHDGAIDIVREALKAGADVNARDGRGMEAISWAALRGHAEVISELVKGGAKVNGLNGSGWPPLGQACGQGQLAAVKALLANGADVNLQFDDGKTALACALHQGFPEVTKALLAAGAKVNADELCGAVTEGSFPERSWTALGAACDVHAADGSAPLCVAAKVGNQKAVVAMLDGGASIDFVDQGKRSALMFAAFQGQGVVVAELLLRKANVNLKSSADFTALDYALKGAEPQIATLLLASGGQMGDIPSVLSFVADHGSVELAKIVLVFKPDLNALDAQGVAPLHTRCSRATSRSRGCSSRMGRSLTSRRRTAQRRSSSLLGSPRCSQRWEHELPQRTSMPTRPGTS